MHSEGAHVFKRYGRSFHMLLESAADLRRTADLDEAHWVATSATVDSIRADPVLLALLDHDQDGRIKVREFKRSIRWVLDVLVDVSGITAGSPTLRRADVNADVPDGQRIRTTLAKLLQRLERDSEAGVSLEEIRTLKRQLEDQPVSEAGVILPAAADEPQTREFLTDILQSVGGVDHPTGEQGVNLAKFEEFCTKAAQYLEWHALGQLGEGIGATSIMPLGPDTPAAFAEFARTRGKLDQYFAQCEALALDPALKAEIWPRETGDVPSDLKDAAQIQALLARSPLAEPNAEHALRLDGVLNPHYVAQLKTFRERVIAPLFGANPSLSAADWAVVKSTFADYEEWQKSKPGREVEALGAERLHTYLSGHYTGAIRDLIQRSAQSGFVLENVRLAEKLAVFQRDLLNLANNFVSFPQLYTPGQRALFEEGSLVMDGRRFNLAVRVHDRAEHAKVTETGAMFVMYVEIEHRLSGRRCEVAVPVTCGTQGNLAVGKRGVFEHVEGTEWAARVVQIVDRPVSLREAVVEPFQRLGRAITGKIESITSAAEQRLEKAGSDAVGQIHQQAAAVPATPAPPPAQTMMTGPAGLLAGGGIAIAAMGSSLAFITKTLAGLRPWQILSGIGGALLAVMVPTAIIAMVRLRARDLSCILEGSGWAINARMRLTRSQSRYFTQRPRYPAGSRLEHRVARWVLTGIVVAALIGGIAGVRWLAQQRRPPPPPAPVSGAEAPDASQPVLP